MRKATTVLDTVEAHSFYRPHKRVQYTGELVNHKTGEVFTPPRRVKQSHVAECDINNIIKSYSQTGQIRHMSQKASMGAYTDLPDNIDFQESMNIVKAGEAAFATLPSQVRDRFGNDPAAFLQFMADPANLEEAVKLGLATRRPEPEPAPGTGGVGGKIPPTREAPPATPPEPPAPKNAS